VLSDEEGQDDVGDGDDAECSRTDTIEGCIFSEVNAVNSLEDISKINFKHLSDEDVMRYHFLLSLLSAIFFPSASSAIGSHQPNHLHFFSLHE
jgi:hypothetical protein